MFCFDLFSAGDTGRHLEGVSILKFNPPQPIFDGTLAAALVAGAFHCGSVAACAHAGRDVLAAAFAAA